MTFASLHSSESSEWHSPADVVELARTVLGPIDLDPASCEAANRTVRAARYITAAEDGLASPWGSVERPATVFLNPPTGPGVVVAFWSRLLAERVCGRLTDAIFLAFSLEQALATQRAGRGILSFPFCIPRKRIAFVCGYAAPAERKQALLFGGPVEVPELKNEAPTHGNAVVYVPGTRDLSTMFCAAFAALGEVRR